MWDRNESGQMCLSLKKIDNIFLSSFFLFLRCNVRMQEVRFIWKKFKNSVTQ